MIKLVRLLRRRPGLSLRDFQEHWLEAHSRFGLADSRVLRHVQYHTLEDDPIREALAQAGTGIDAYDGMAVTWTADVAGMKGALENGAAVEDERHFVDRETSVALLVDEHVHIEPGRPSPILLVECLARRADIDRETFSERWLKHSALAHTAHASGFLAGYIQNHALLEGDRRVAELGPALVPGPDDWDGIVNAYFHSVAVAKNLFATPLASEEAYEDERTFFDHDKSAYMLVRRHVVKELVR